MAISPRSIARIQTKIILMNIFRRKYFYLTLIFLLIEIFIAAYVRDSFVRPFVGDVLVVILVYCFIQSFWKIQPVKAMAGVFLFACIVEGLQYLNIVDKLGLRPYKLLVIILGSSFDWGDILAYAVGSAIVILVESNLRLKPRH
jgi:Protein of unknown function (DUF2809)